MELEHNDVLSLEAFVSRDTGYRLLPFRFGRIPGVVGKVLLVSDAGEFLFLSEDDFQSFIAKQLPAGSDLFLDLEAKDFLVEADKPPPIRRMASKYRTKKCFLRGGPALHEFVVTLRCDHSCRYCQASRQPTHRTEFDMPREVADSAVDRMFQSPARDLTVEFQGGEPLLAFDTIRRIVDRILQRNQRQQRRIGFTIVSTLHHISDDVLAFLKEHDFQVSTSIDGPEWLHNANRPCPSHDSFARTASAVQRAREVLGETHIAALTTLTKQSLEYPEAIVETYAELGFKSIFLRPISPYGFALKSDRKSGYSTAEFVAFYERALNRIIELNAVGVEMDEAYAAILLTHILTPFPTGYVDLRSPCGGGIGVIVYNYDGRVYLCDESRMLAEMGDLTFCLGSVHDPYQSLIRSEPIAVAVNASVTEALPGCVDCVFQPYCGVCPVHSVVRHGDPFGSRPSSEHCARQKGLFEVLFRRIAQPDDRAMKLFTAWSLRQPLGASCMGGACR